MSTHGGPSGGGGGGGLLARVQYAPAVLATYAAAVINPTATDAVHLTIAFVAPTSGDVLVRLTANVQATGGEAYFCLLGHTSGDQVGDTATLLSAITLSPIVALSVPILVTGLTANDTYQYDWAFFCNNGSSMFVQGAQGIPSTAYAGPATMEILAA